MKHILLISILPAALTFAALSPSAAQAPADTTPRTAADSALANARALIKEGKETEGRRMIDSLVRASTPDSAIYAEALYWRGTFASAADAERDYKRLLIEAPLSPRAEDAMLRLANLLQARGDRRGASDHLQRYMLTYSNSPARPRVALSLVRLLFDQGPQQQARACEALRLGRETIPREMAELRNQLEYYEPRCVAEVAPTPVATDSTSTAPVTSTTPPDSTARPVTPPPAAAATPASSSTPTSFYSVQVAAYNSKEPAQSLANLLAERGLAARVDGTTSPYRVRVGKYTTRAEAVKAAATLKSQGHNGFITLVQGTK